MPNTDDLLSYDELRNARLDALTLQSFINDAATNPNPGQPNGTVTSRLGQTYLNAAAIAARLQNLPANDVVLPNGVSVRDAISLHYASRAAAIVDIADNTLDYVPNGILLSDGRVIYIRVLGSTVISDMPGWEAFGIHYTLFHFGAGGAGLTDDTQAVIRAIGSGMPLDWGTGTYNVTAQITLTVLGVNWISSGATIRYTGTSPVRYALWVTYSGSGEASIRGRLSMNGGNTAFSVFRLESTAAANTSPAVWPSAYLAGMVIEDYRRASTSITGGDGFFLVGGWRKATVVVPEVRNGFMSSGAGVPLSQGIFGMTFGDNNAPQRPLEVVLIEPTIENIWSDDATYVADQDAIRVIQDLETNRDAPASFRMTGGHIRNVSNRAVKLSSAPNAIIDGLTIFYDNTVVPQTAASTNPTIDGQQAPVIVSNVKATYIGRAPDRFINNFSQHDDHPNFGGVISNVLVTVSDGAGTNMDIIALTGSPLSTGDSDTRLKVVNVGVEGGPVKNFLSMRVDDNSATGITHHRADLINCSAECAENFVEFTGQNTTPALVSALNCAHLGDTAIDFSNKSGLWEVRTLSCDNFSDLTNLSVSGAGQYDFEVDGVSMATISPTGEVTLRGNTRIARNNPNFLLQDTIAGNTANFRSDAGSLIVYNDFESTGVVGTFQVRIGGPNVSDLVLDVGTRGTFRTPQIPVYADNAAAVAAGMVANEHYITATGESRVVV